MSLEYRPKPAKILSEVLDGYRRIGAVLLRALLLLGGAGLLSVIVVVPLWLAATRATAAYTTAVLLAVAGALGTGLVRRLAGARRQAFRPILRVAARVITTVAGLYAVVLLYAAGRVGPAVILVVIGLAWVGYAVSGKRKYDSVESSG
ncbi:MAG: hypothetical protein ACLFUM_03830 [Spirochaetaceae bacterium]